MKTLRVELTEGGRSLAEAKIQRGIFQGDVLTSDEMSPLFAANRESAVF